MHGLRVLGDALVAHAQRLPAPGQLHRDEGQGFALWGEPLPQGEFLDFVVRSSDDVVLALIQDDGADPALWVSDPSLETWTLAAVLEGLNQPRFIDLELGERRKVIAALRGAAGELWIVDADDTLSRRAQLPTPVQEGRTHGDEHWVITLTGCRSRRSATDRSCRLKGLSIAWRLRGPIWSLVGTSTTGT